jgi:hypothetical protein
LNNEIREKGEDRKGKDINKGENEMRFALRKEKMWMRND